MLAFQQAGAEVFDNGNLIRTQAKQGGVENAFDIPIFTEAYLRPLFARAIGPFRWMALSGDPDDIAPHRRPADADVSPTTASSPTGSASPASTSRSRACPPASPGSATANAPQLALAVNDMVRKGELAGPVAFSRDHLDAGAMAHPNIMTENMKDGSDAIADWPLLDAMLPARSQADLVAIHSGGGGYAGYMTCAGVTLIADGTEAADERLSHALTNDTSLGVMRYADAGYEEAREAARAEGLDHFDLRLGDRRPLNGVRAGSSAQFSGRVRVLRHVGARRAGVSGTGFGGGSRYGGSQRVEPSGHPRRNGRRGGAGRKAPALGDRQHLRAARHAEDLRGLEGFNIDVVDEIARRIGRPSTSTGPSSRG